LPEGEIVAISEGFVQDTRAQANWKAYVKREGLGGLNPLGDALDLPRR
jgi:hypothetical protein